ncbi:MAG: hypothetical protein ACJ8KU_06540 [Chthoniobacterales bacterium]
MKAKEVLRRVDIWVPVALAILTAVLFSWSIKPIQQHFDYTARIASALLHGHVGLKTQPPSWLNEMVPHHRHYYSVFPLGAVLSMIPVATLQQIGLAKNFPGGAIAALLAGLCVYFLFQLSGVATNHVGRRIVLSLAMIFGTWFWANIGFGGAWQLALGFALLGQLGALCFILLWPRPLIAGAFFALAYGNRTEVILTVPIYAWYLCFGVDQPRLDNAWQQIRQKMPALIQFLSVPVLLGLLTAAYNFGRFHSVFDFGYDRIPKLLQEPWYRHGLFSVHAIPWNMHKMLFEGFTDIPNFPFVRFYPFGCSIFLASPFLFLLFREGGTFKVTAWIAIALLTFALWCHGNPGGWQFSYRYGIILFPWMFLIILANGPAKLSVIEVSLVVASIAINATATYEFLWTGMIHP